MHDGTVGHGLPMEILMLKALLLAAAVTLPLPVLAADVTLPVRDVMAVATTLWSGEEGGDVDYFDADHIGDFSAAFRTLYAEASKHPAFDSEDGTGSPFDYDPIISGQDGCALEGLTIGASGKAASATDVVARFKRFSCFEDSSDEERNAVSEVHFRVVVEKGKPVIDDVVSGEGADRISLVETMKAIIKG